MVSEPHLIDESGLTVVRDVLATPGLDCLKVALADVTTQVQWIRNLEYDTSYQAEPTALVYLEIEDKKS